MRRVLAFAFMFNAATAVAQACPSIMDHGGNNTASGDNTSAFYATISASPSGQACVYFPSGTYQFSSRVSYTLPDVNSSLTVLGNGPNATRLEWAGGGGMQVTMPGGAGNSVHIRDMSLLTGGAGVGYAAIALINATSSAAPEPVELSDITNVSIHGEDGFAINDYWVQGIYESSWSNINFMGVTVDGGGGGGNLSGYSAQGIGILLIGNSGSNAAPQGVVYNITDSQFNYLQMGVQYNNWTQGVTISQSNFGGGEFGVYVASPGLGQDQLTITASQFNESGYAVVDNIGVPALMLSGNYIFVPTPASNNNNTGVYLAVANSAVISGNTFQRLGSSAAGTNGIAIGSNGNAGAMITGNVITGMQTGILLQSASSGNNVQSNLYHGNGTNIVNSGSGNVLGGGSQ